MSNLSIVTEQVIFLAVMMAIGFIAERFRIVKGMSDRVSTVIIRISMPLLIITSLSKRTLDSELLTGAAFVFAGAVIAQAVLAALGYGTARMFRLKDDRLKQHICLSTFGNVIFLAFPLIKAIYGDTGLFYALIYALANDGLLWTAGIYSLSGGKSFKKLINPNTISFATGIVMMFLNIKIPQIIFLPLESVGALTTPLSMLFIGAALASVPVRDIVKKVSLVSVLVVKMTFIPVVLMYVLSSVRLGYDWIPIDAAAVLIMQAAMPAQTILTVIVRDMGMDSDYCATAALVTTVYALISLPLIYNAISVFFG